MNLLVETCHRRGVHVMGSMAAQIPIKNDPATNEQALEKVRQDRRAGCAPVMTAGGWHIPA